MSEIFQLSESGVIDVIFAKSGVPSTVTPAPTFELRKVSDNTLIDSGTLTAVGNAYPYTVSQAAGALYRLTASTSDATADYPTFIEECRIGQTWIQSFGAFTGTGVNTILGFLKALGSKSASTPSDMGGTYDAATDSLEAINDNLATVQNVVDGTWDEPIAAHLNPGSTGEALDAGGGGGGDPLLNPVPAAYAVGTAGYNLGLLPTIEAQTSLITDGTEIIISNPVNPENLALTLYNQTDYSAASGVSLPSWTGDWTAYGLQTATVVLYYADKNSTIDTALGTIVVDSATSIHLTVDAADVFAVPLGPNAVGYKIIATLDAGHGNAEVTLVNAGLSHYNYVLLPTEPNTQP